MKRVINSTDKNRSSFNSHYKLVLQYADLLDFKFVQALLIKPSHSSFILLTIIIKSKVVTMYDYKLHKSCHKI
jgi:hypothetical protein